MSENEWVGLVGRE